MNNTQLFHTPVFECGPSYFTSKSSTTPIQISWQSLVDTIKHDTRLKFNTALARQYRDKGDNKMYSITKSRAGAITPAAICEGGHKASNIIRLTSVSLVDIDHVPINQLDQIIQTLKNDPHTFILYTTASGQGIRVLFRYTTSAKQINYRYAWQLGNQYFAMMAGINYDTVISDPTRLSFLASDPNIYYNPNSLYFVVENQDDFLAEITPSDNTTSGDLFSRCHNILQKQGINNTQGSRHAYTMQMARLLLKYGVPQSEAQSLCAPLIPEDEKEVSDIISWTYNNLSQHAGAWVLSNTRSHTPRTESNSDNSDTNSDTDSDTTFDQVKQVKKSSSSTATPEQIQQYLDNNELLRYNVISDTVELFSPESKEYIPINDRTANTIWQQCIIQLQRYVKDTDFNKVINSEFVKPYNPFEEYFNSLPDWDGTDYINILANTVTTTAQPPIFEMCLKKWLVGMAASWLEPKVMNETILTFIGSQGMYKSTFFRFIMPPQLQKYFMAKPNSSYISKDDRIAVSNYALIALEEIDSLKDADLNSIKALVTMETIDERAAYARNREKRPHLASFCATGNNKTFLTDLTGNRRWLPFEVISINDPRDTFKSLLSYENLYSQVKYLLSQKFQYWFSRQEDIDLEEYKSQFTEPCIEQELVQKYYRKPKEFESGRFLTTTEITARCSVDLRSLSTKKVAQVMLKLGYKPIRTRLGRGFVVVPREYNEIDFESFQVVNEQITE